MLGACDLTGHSLAHKKGGVLVCVSPRERTRVRSRPYHEPWCLPYGVSKSGSTTSARFRSASHQASDVAQTEVVHGPAAGHGIHLRDRELG